MEYQIRPYTAADYPMISSWWAEQKEPGPTEDMLPLDSTVIVETAGCPILCQSMILTNVKGFCYVENLVGNPEFKGKRREAGHFLASYWNFFAKEKGYDRIVTFSYRPGVCKVLEDYGWIKTVGGLQAFVKEVI